jgi:hypothetical protein
MRARREETVGLIPLRDLQAAFRDALLTGEAGAAASGIEGDGLTPEARIDLYRHHLFTTLTAVLESTYPVVCRLVDRRFFGYAADAYIRANPPTGPCLFEYGATLPEFLEAFPPCRGHAFLPDVARLEWAMHAALHAPDAVPLDPVRLTAVGTPDIARLVLAFDPSVALVASPWPIDRIWRANQDGATADGRLDLRAGGARLEVRRVDGDVVMRALDLADHAFRAALLRASRLDRAATAALAVDPAFDLTRALHELLDERIAVDFTVSN